MSMNLEDFGDFFRWHILNFNVKVENQKITESWGYWPMALITSQIQDLKKP